MNTVNSITIIGMLLLLSACDGSPDTASEASTPAAEAPTPAAEAPDVAAPPAAGAVDPSTAAAAGDAQPCVGADVEIADARRKEFLRLVVGAVDNKVKPEAVEIDGFMRIGTWSAVYATTPIADPGWFVFESADGRHQFKDVWGGMADEGDRQGLVEWATGLGAPAKFAACFAETVIN